MSHDYIFEAMELKNKQMKPTDPEKRLERDEYGLFIHADNYDEMRARVEYYKDNPVRETGGCAVWLTVVLALCLIGIVIITLKI